MLLHAWRRLFCVVDVAERPPAPFTEDVVEVSSRTKSIRTRPPREAAAATPATPRPPRRQPPADGQAPRRSRAYADGRDNIGQATQGRPTAEHRDKNVPRRRLSRFEKGDPPRPDPEPPRRRRRL